MKKVNFGEKEKWDGQEKEKGNEW